MFCRTFNLKEVLNSIGVQTCIEVNKTLAERGLSILNAEVQANLVGQFSSIEEEDNPIWSLIGRSSCFGVFALNPLCFNLLILIMVKCQSSFILKQITYLFGDSNNEKNVENKVLIFSKVWDLLLLHVYLVEGRCLRAFYCTVQQIDFYEKNAIVLTTC